jgi:hypothetical protein
MLKMNVLKLLLIIVVVFGAIQLSTYLALSNAGKTILIAGTLAICVLGSFWFDSKRKRASERSSPPHLARGVLLWRIVAGVVGFVGIGLWAGNRLGTFPTFPMAGGATLGAAVLIYVLLGRP